MRTLGMDEFRDAKSIGRLASRLARFAGSVHLDVDAQRRGGWSGRGEVCTAGFQVGGFFEGVAGLDGPEVRNGFGELAGFVGLELADEVPVDFARESRRFVEKLLYVVFAKVGMCGGRIEGEDIGGGLKLRDGYEADLQRVSGVGGESGGVRTGRVGVATALMRETTARRFSARA